VGIDFSHAMLEIARRGARDEGVADRTRFVQDEFLGHDFGGERFDVVIAMGVFDYLEKPEPFLAKMAQVARGKIVASFPRFSLVRGTARRLRYRLTGRGDVFYYSPSDVARLAERSGIARARLVRIDASGGGVVLVGEIG
jgi:SAM-dependent methyltransferase